MAVATQDRAAPVAVAVVGTPVPEAAQEDLGTDQAVLDRDHADRDRAVTVRVHQVVLAVATRVLAVRALAAHRVVVVMVHPSRPVPAADGVVPRPAVRVPRVDRVAPVAVAVMQDPAVLAAATMGLAEEPRRAVAWATVPGLVAAVTGEDRAAHSRVRPPSPDQDPAVVSRAAAVTSCQHLDRAVHPMTVVRRVVPRQGGNAMPSVMSSTSDRRRRA